MNPHLSDNEVALLHGYPKSSPHLIHKWCQAFLVYLIFKAGGQRAKIYSLILCPSEDELCKMEDESKRNSFFSMRTGNEARECPIWAPRFVLPTECLVYIRFHTRFVRFLIEEDFPNAAAADCDALILDPRNGCNIVPTSVFHLLRSFLRSVDHHTAEAITCERIRFSFAALRLRQLVSESRTTRPGGSIKHQFLLNLAAVMNTSLERLSEIYASIEAGESTASLQDAIQTL